MNRATLAMLSTDERLLVEATETRQLALLDEDEVSDLLLRVRRARNKYTKLYRRQASAQVRADSARGAASVKNRGTRDKAEVFEDALARVSRRLATLARQSAAELRTERLDAARTAGGARAGRTPSRTAGDPPVGDVGRKGGKTPVSRKQVASTRAANARQQAKRDSS